MGIVWFGTMNGRFALERKRMITNRGKVRADWNPCRGRTAERIEPGFSWTLALSLWQVQKDWWSTDQQWNCALMLVVSQKSLRLERVRTIAVADSKVVNLPGRPMVMNTSRRTRQAKWPSSDPDTQRKMCTREEFERTFSTLSLSMTVNTFLETRIYILTSTTWHFSAENDSYSFSFFFSSVYKICFSRHSLQFDSESMWRNFYSFSARIFRLWSLFFSSINAILTEIR